MYCFCYVSGQGEEKGERNGWYLFHGLGEARAGERMRRVGDGGGENLGSLGWLSLGSQRRKQEQGSLFPERAERGKEGYTRERESHGG